MEIGSLKSLVECFFKRAITAHNFAGRLHLWSQKTVNLRQLSKREDWRLDMNHGTFWMKAVFITQLCQTFSKDQTSRYLRHRNIGHLGQERNGPAGTRIDLNDIDLLIFDDELNIHHADTVQS